MFHRWYVDDSSLIPYLGGISANDIALAKMIDAEVDIIYSPKWLKSHPEAAK